MFPEVFVGFIISSLLGAVVGSQREIRQQKQRMTDFAGFRTFTLICVLGFLIGYLSFDVFESTDLILVGIAGIFILTSIAYMVVSKIYSRQISIIGEVSAIITFIIGILVSIQEYHLAITIAIFISSILFLGSYLHKFAKKITVNEVFASLKFAIISLVILPFLPNQNYGPLDIPLLREILESQSLISLNFLAQLNVFNPFTIWFMVILISGIAYVGYILMKTLGADKGILITGFLGGLMSSTALTSSFAIESKRMKYLSNPLSVGIIIASATMFIRVLVEVTIFNSNLLYGLISPLILMFIVGYIVAYHIFKKEKLNHVKKMKLESPFSLGPALKFAIFFVFVVFMTKAFSLNFGDKGIYLLAFLSGIADVDAITISLATLALSGEISQSSAVIGIFLASISNTIFKGGIAYYLGSKKLSRNVMISFMVIIGSGLLLFFIM